MKKNHINKLIREQKKDLKSSRIFINKMIKRLEVTLDEGRLDEISEEEWKKIWGGKENILSSLAQLTSMLTKIIPLEHKLTDSEISAPDEQEDENLNENEKEILENFILATRNSE